MLYTTLNLCKTNNACSDGFRELKKSLPKDHGDDAPISLLHIIKSNGYMDAAWALKATTKPCRDIATEYAFWCAWRVLEVFEEEYPNDNRIRDCIEGVQKYQRGEISNEDLCELRLAANDAGHAATDNGHDTAACAAYTAFAFASHYVYYDGYTYHGVNDSDDDIRKERENKLVKLLKAHKEN